MNFTKTHGNPLFRKNLEEIMDLKFSYAGKKQNKTRTQNDLQFRNVLEDCTNFLFDFLSFRNKIQRIGQELNQAQRVSSLECQSLSFLPRFNFEVKKKISTLSKSSIYHHQDKKSFNLLPFA